MSTPQNMLSRRNAKKPPQWAAEGINPADFAKVIDNPAFTAPLQKSLITKSNENTFIDNMYAGTYERQGILKTREANTLNLKGRVCNVADALNLLKWFLNEPNGIGTPQQSRTWLDTYEDNSGTEIYRVWKGCKPLAITINVTKDDTIMVDCQMSAKEYYEKDSLSDAKITGSPVYDVEPRDDAIRFKDLGKFIYDTNGVPGNGDNLPFRSFSLTATWTPRVQDSNGSESDVYRDYAEIRITGSADIFKSGPALNEDARAGKQVIAFLELLASSTADTQAERALPTSSATDRLVFKSRLPGASGHKIKVGTVSPSTARSATKIGVVGREISIYLKNGGDTLQNIKDLVDANPLASKLVTVTIVGAASTNITTAVSANLQNGTDGSTKIVLERMRFLPSAEDLLDQTEATIESKSYEADGVIMVTA